MADVDILDVSLCAIRGWIFKFIYFFNLTMKKEGELNAFSSFDTFIYLWKRMKTRFKNICTGV